MKHVRLVAIALVLGLALLPLGCAASEEPAEEPAAEEPATDPLADVEPEPIVIGTLPTEDALPLWAAEAEGLFTEAGLDVEIVVFPAAQERDTAFTSGAIDAFMGDIIASANLEAAGSGVALATVMLGQTPAEGRFGIAVAPGTDWRFYDTKFTECIMGRPEDNPDGYKTNAPASSAPTRGPSGTTSTRI